VLVKNRPSFDMSIFLGENQNPCYASDTGQTEAAPAPRRPEKWGKKSYLNRAQPIEKSGFQKIDESK
jgi:hypothetical protein